jgi:hypothetical protein
VIALTRRSITVRLTTAGRRIDRQAPGRSESAIEIAVKSRRTSGMRRTQREGITGGEQPIAATHPPDPSIAPRVLHAISSPSTATELL